MSEQVIYTDEQGQPIDMPQNTGGIYQSPSNDSKADILDKIRPEAIVEMIRHKLMGEELIDGAWQKVEALKFRSLSEVGAWELANLMVAVSSQNVSISKLRDDEIKPRLRSIVRAAMYKMLRNWKVYGVKGTDQFYYVKEIIYSNTLVSLKQSEGAGIRKMIMGVRHEDVRYNEQPAQKKSWGESLFRPKQ